MSEDFLPECVDRTVKFGGGNVTMLGCITCDGVGPLVKVKGSMNSDDYIKLFSDTLLSFTASVGPELFYYPAFYVIPLKILIAPNFWPVYSMHSIFWCPIKIQFSLKDFPHIL